MKRLSIIVFIFAFIAGVTYSQEAEAPVMRFDDAVSFLAGQIHAKLIENNAEKIIIGQFTFNNDSPTFSTYWINQLIDQLVNMRGRNYRVHSGNTQDGWLITGEIVQVTGIIRVYSRLIRLQDRAIEGSFTSSFTRDSHINEMIFSDSSRSESSVSETRDSYEPDSWDSPVFYTVGTSSTVPVMNRLLSDDDEDFFLLVPDADGRLTAETTGNIDTYMYLYDYESGEELADNDDGGANANARIIFNVRSGVSYLVIVSGYSSSTTGSYGFRAYITRREGVSGFDNPLSYEIGANEEEAAVVNRTLQQGDEDYFLLIPDRDGRLTMETTGRTDTYMEFFDADRDLIDRNDDGGQNNNARIRYNVRSGGRYYVMVRGYSQHTTGNYGFRAFYPGSNMLSPDEHEPNNEPSLARSINLGATQQHTFHSGDDVDWVRFTVTRAGRYVINTRGVNNNRLDTYIELFDSNMNLIAEDDDGGDSLSSRLSLSLATGAYFLKVWCLDDEPDQAYTINIASE